MRVNSTCRPAWTGPRVRGRRFWACLCEAGTGGVRTRAAFEAAASSGGGAPRCRTAPSAHGGSGRNRRRREGEFSPFVCCPLSGGGSRRLRPLGRDVCHRLPRVTGLGTQTDCRLGPRCADGRRWDVSASGTARADPSSAPYPVFLENPDRYTLYCDPYSVCTPGLGPPFGTG